MRFLAIIAVFFAFTAMAAPLTKATIQTNANCEMCQSTIESTLSALDGVKKASLDLVTKKVTVKFDADVIELAQLRQAIAAVGYNADDVPARPKAQEALADCCKPKTTSCCADKSKSCKKPE